MDSLISKLYKFDDKKYVVFPSPSGGSVVTNMAHDAMRGAADINAAYAGKPFEVSDAITNEGGQLSTFRIAEEKQAQLEPWTESSAKPVPRSAGAVISEPVYSAITVPARVPGEISDDVLAMIRAFVPKDEDKLFIYVDYAPATSAILAHRQRAMSLLNKGYTPAAIRMAVEEKGKKFLANLEERNAVMGIPKKKLELILSDSVLIHRNTSYSLLLRELFNSKCVTSDGMIQLVPDYIGVGGKTEKTQPTEAETLRRRKRFLTSTAQYLAPLYTSESFRQMITAQRLDHERVSAAQ